MLTGLIVATFVVLVGYGVTTMSFAPLTATAHWPLAITIIPYMLQVCVPTTHSQFHSQVSIWLRVRDCCLVRVLGFEHLM